LGVEIQQLEVDLPAFGLEHKVKKNVEQPIVSTKRPHTYEHNEVNFDLPPTFDKYE